MSQRGKSTCSRRPHPSDAHKFPRTDATRLHPQDRTLCRFVRDRLSSQEYRRENVRWHIRYGGSGLFFIFFLTGLGWGFQASPKLSINFFGAPPFSAALYVAAPRLQEIT